MAIWYFGQGGAPGNTGQSFAQRKGNHNTQLAPLLVPTDTVYICANASGLANRYTLTEQLIPVSGVTYRIFMDHYIWLDVNTPNVDEGAIHIVGKNNITIEPGDGFLECGNIADWTPDFPWYDADRQLNVKNSTNIRLIGRWSGTWPDDTATSNFIVHGGRRYVGNIFDRDCDLYLVSGIDFNRHGTNNTGTAPTNPDYTPNIDWGDGLVFAGTRGYVYQCRGKYMGHAAYSSCRSFVTDDCVWDGDWSGVTPNADAGRGAPIEHSGQRCFSLTGGNTDDDDHAGGVSPYGPQMIQNCILKTPGSAGDEKDNTCSEHYAVHVINRFNYYWDSCNDSWRASTFGDAIGDPFPDSSVSYMKSYNNTSYGCGKLMDYRNVMGIEGYLQIDVLNNIFDEMVGAYFGSTIAQYRRLHSNPLESNGGYPNEWKGGVTAGNLWKMKASAISAGYSASITVRLQHFGGTVTTDTAVEALEVSYPSNWYNNTIGSPTYAGNPASGQRTKAAFAPNGGAAVGNGEPHAIAGAGSGTTTLTVGSGQARRFFDCWDMESLGAEADWIKIGASAPVQIATNGINYGTDQIGLSSSRVWTPGDEVYLCLTPDGVNFTIVADTGAGQTPGATIPATGVAGYEVAKGLSDAGVIRPGTFEWFDVGNTLTHTFTGLLPNQEYYFRVRAYDDAGNFSDPSAPRLFVTTNP